MDINAFVQDWLAAGNAYDTKKYLAKYHEDAILDDPSVGSTFVGHAGIKKYFEDYFIGYKTQTRLIKLGIINNQAVHVEVEFTGNFPGGLICGMFDLTFAKGKIASATADLI